MITVRTATISDAIPIGARLCSPDAVPLLAQGLDLQEVAERSISGSDEAWAFSVTNDDRLDEAVGVFGASTSGGETQVWLLATDELFETHSKFFLRVTKPVLGGFKELYKTVVAYADPTNKQLTRWLKWSSFQAVGEITDSTGRLLTKWELK